LYIFFWISSSKVFSEKRDSVLVGIFGKYSSRISEEFCIHFASHFAISELVPELVSRNISPGTANTSRPCSSARFAVINVPLFTPASGMMMPSERAATISLRIGK